MSAAPYGMDPPHVCVLGFGRSGEAMVRTLMQAGDTRSVAVVERRDDAEVRARAADLEGSVQLLFGETTLADYAAMLGHQPDLVVVSPGVPPTNPLLAGALAAGVRVWSEPELAWRLSGGRTRLVAVTGTNGKTTTTELLAELLDAPTAGNIGTPLVEALTAAEPPEVVVAELSSFQLRFTETLRPDVAVLLNLAPDHLDWHHDLADYAASKARIWATQDAAGWAVVDVDDAGARCVLAEHPPPAGTVTVTADAPGEGQVGVVDGTIVARLAGVEAAAIAQVDELGAPGPHNLHNALAAVAAALCAGADPTTLAAPLRSWRAGPHRLEHVAERAGVRYVNDSKATNPHAAAAALATFAPGGVVWIGGGLAKGLAFDDLAEIVRARVRLAITIGDSGRMLADAVRRWDVAAIEAGDLATAVRVAAQRSRVGDVVLFAPACASMDQFRDYAERGQAFRDAVGALPGEDAAASSKEAGSGR